MPYPPKTGPAAQSLAALHGAVLLFGLAAVLGRFVDLPAVIVAAGRVVCSSALLLAMLAARRAPLRLGCATDYALALGGGVVLAAHWTTFFLAVQTASVAVGTIGFATFPLFLVLLEPLAFREKPRPRDLAGAALVLAGAAVTKNKNRERPTVRGTVGRSLFGEEAALSVMRTGRWVSCPARPFRPCSKAPSSAGPWRTGSGTRTRPSRTRWARWRGSWWKSPHSAAGARPGCSRTGSW